MTSFAFSCNSQLDEKRMERKMLKQERDISTHIFVAIANSMKRGWKVLYAAISASIISLPRCNSQLDEKRMESLVLWHPSRDAMNICVAIANSMKRGWKVKQ